MALVSLTGTIFFCTFSIKKNMLLFSLRSNKQIITAEQLIIIYAWHANLNIMTINDFLYENKGLGPKTHFWILYIVLTKNSCNACAHGLSNINQDDINKSYFNIITNLSRVFDIKNPIILGY